MEMMFVCVLCKEWLPELEVGETGGLSAEEDELGDRPQQSRLHTPEKSGLLLLDRI
jgi:hypothetical protein